jgi:predicted enzyme related to lactoylglutathione lyase
MQFLRAAVAACVLAAATAAAAQESDIRVRSIRVLASDVDAVASFYQKAFGMSEVSRPVNSPTFKEVIINSGSTPELARKATSVPIVIATRPKDAAPPAMAALILDVPNLEKAIESVKANGGTLMRPPSKFGNISFAFVKDPDGNQIELIASQN